jgi:hypothetical protein
MFGETLRNVIISVVFLLVVKYSLDSASPPPPAQGSRGVGISADRDLYDYLVSQSGDKESFVTAHTRFPLEPAPLDGAKISFDMPRPP